MSPVAFVLLLIVAIVLLSVLTLKLKIHPVITLFLVATFIGLCTGHSLPETMTLIKNYFGSTLTGVGVLIIFGAIIASGINDTGAATSIANFFIRLFRGKRLELAPSLTGFIMSIPVFGDIAIVLNAPISAILAKRKKMSMAVMAPFVNLGLTLTHGLVPPTPGILAVSVLLGADIGQVILWGLLCSLISFAVSYLILRPIYARGEYIEPMADFTEGIEPVADDASIDELLIKEDNCPSAAVAFLPLLLPAVMIAIGSIGKLAVAEGSVAYNILTTVGDSVVALFCGVIAVALIALSRFGKVTDKAREQSPKLAANPKFFEVVGDNWVARALDIAIGPLMITAMGGAMGGILRENEAIGKIGEMVTSTAFPVLLIPFILSAILMAVCGSMTTASMTAASLLLPMMPAMGLSPVVVALAIGAGSMCFWHINNSGFWVFTSLYGFNTKQGLKYFTTTNLFGGIVAFAALALLAMTGLIP
jgi:GntP family gluconate:H+ symporter